MGRVRTKTVKKSSRQVIEKYYSRMTLDFHTNKELLEEVAIIPTKLQEEERERRMGFVPAESAIKTDSIAVDPETIETMAPAPFPARGGARRY